MTYLWIALGVVVGAILIAMIIDTIRVLKIKQKPALPIQAGKKLTPMGLVTLITYFSDPNSKPDDIELTDEYILLELSESFEYVDTLYDCSDFIAHLLFRFYMDYKNELSDTVKDRIKKTFLNFKYWMDLPLEESMCFFSENHTLLFAGIEMLAGQEWAEELFPSSGLTGAEHMARGNKRFIDWCDQRYKFGFFEWYSGNYWNEDLGGLMQILQYSSDAEIVKNAKKIIDYMMFEVATHSINGRFVTVSSRQYGDNKATNARGNRMYAALQFMLFGNYSVDGAEKFDAVECCRDTTMDVCLCMCFTEALRQGIYTMPAVIKDIALDSSKRIIKTNNGLDPEEYKGLGLIGTSDYQSMAQFSNEIFINRGFAQNTYKIHKKNDSFTNIFSSPMQFADIFPLRNLGILSLLCNTLNKNFAITGSALTRGKVYTYRKGNAMLATACDLHVDYFGNQHHVVHANLSEDVNIYPQYPTSLTNLAGAPGYWGGQRRLPMAQQDEGVSLCLYRMDRLHRLAENKPVYMTHVMFPTERLEEYCVDKNKAFATVEGTHIAIICNKDLALAPYDSRSALAQVTHNQSSVVANSPNEGTEKDLLKKEFDLCAHGYGYHGYVLEISDNSKESYSEFIARVSANDFKVEGNKMFYTSNGKSYELGYKHEFLIDNKAVSADYNRFDSEYCTFKDGVLDIAYNDKSLKIDLSL
ncbi:MAG: hypothetical protein R3Y23_01250 [Bacillota bacterium]